MPSSTDDFFDVPRECSKVKAQIVSKYVQSWSKILSDYLRSQGKNAEVAFIDLFSGPGQYSDGTPSTPLLVLKAATQDRRIGESLRSFFNDINPESVTTLSEAIKELPGIDRLSFQPELRNEEATASLIQSLNLPHRIPKLYFLDQFGYKHVTYTLIAELLSDWAECIFFFNYRRVIAAIENPVMAQNVIGLFGNPVRVKALQTDLSKQSGALSRENTVLNYLIEAMREAGAKHVQAFGFKVEDSQRSTHHLIFLSKSDKGYEIMKGIMAREGKVLPTVIPTMSFTQNESVGSGNLFPVDEIEDLANELSSSFHGRTVSLYDVFTEHSPGKPFLPAHYRDAILRLELRGRVAASPPAAERPKKKGSATMALNTRITFTGA